MNPPKVPQQLFTFGLVLLASALEAIALATRQDGIMFSGTMAFFGAALGARFLGGGEKKP